MSQDPKANGQHSDAKKQTRKKPTPRRTFTIKNQEHFLPNPRALTPFIDQKAGEFDLWPAHASTQDGSSATAVLTKRKGLALITDEETHKPEVTPKPRFLDQLEKYVKKELRTLNVVEVKPNELRLQVYRQVFEALIENFTTYRSILAAVKNEYEMMLNKQKQKIRELQPLQENLISCHEQYEQELHKFLQEEKKDVNELKQINRRQLTEIDAMKNEKLALEKQVKRLQKLLSEEYRRYRNESDARKLLVIELANLRYLPEDMSGTYYEKAYQSARENPFGNKVVHS